MRVPHISTPVLGFFRFIVRGYFRRHFTAVRVSEAARWASLPAGPVIVYANHTSWWDPMVSVLLAQRFMPERRHYAPMDAAALDRYPILKQIGVFPVEQESGRSTTRGSSQFMRTGLAILKSGGVVWITPQGRFADVREPLEFKPGLAALAGRAATVLPMAIEYAFWDERLPEVLLHFGEPIQVAGQVAGKVAGEVSDELLRSRLAEAMETLKAKAVARDPSAFATVVRGRAGVGGFYGAGQRMVARLRGRRYQAEHTAAER